MMQLSDGYPMEALFAQIAELSLEVGGIHCEPPHGWRRIRGDTVIHQDRYTDGSHRYALPCGQAAVATKPCAKHEWSRPNPKIRGQREYCRNTTITWQRNGKKVSEH